VTFEEGARLWNRGEVQRRRRLHDEIGMRGDPV
jgi:hypothetical protein